MLLDGHRGACPAPLKRRPQIKVEARGVWGCYTKNATWAPHVSQWRQNLNNYGREPSSFDLSPRDLKRNFYAHLQIRSIFELNTCCVLETMEHVEINEEKVRWAIWRRGGGRRAAWHLGEIRHVLVNRVPLQTYSLTWLFAVCLWHLLRH